MIATGFDCFQQFASPEGVSDKREAISLVVMRGPFFMVLVDGAHLGFNWQMPLQRYVLRQRIYLKVHWGKKPKSPPWLRALRVQCQQQVQHNSNDDFKLQVSEQVVSGSQAIGGFSVHRPWRETRRKGFSEEEIRASFQCLLISSEVCL